MSARILMIDTVYPAFIRWLYAREPGLMDQRYAEQLSRALETCYHNVSVWAAPLRMLGYDVQEVWANHAPLQYAWCREQGRLDLFPGSDRSDLPALFNDVHKVRDWFIGICVAQVRAFRPDILWLSNLYTFTDSFLAAVEGHYRHAVGQNAAMPPEDALSRFDLAVSASATNVEYFRGRGLKAELLPHGFNPRVLAHLPEVPEPPVRDFAFFGNFYPAHAQRREHLLSIAKGVPIEVWTDAKLPRAFDQAGVKRHPALWGVDMYREVARTATVLNSHIDSTGDWATNQRLYEVTGCGAVLLTDQKSNLGDIFEIGSECLAYASPEECVEQVRWLGDHPDEARAIARRGQRRTLTEHTVQHRGLRIQELLMRHGLAT